MSDKQRACGEHAAFRFTWPGKAERHVCVDHAMQIMGLASAISLPLQMVPLSYKVSDPTPTEFPTCSQPVTDECVHSGVRR